MHGLAGPGVDGAGVDHQGLGASPGQNAVLAVHHLANGVGVRQGEQHDVRARREVLGRADWGGAEAAGRAHPGGPQVVHAKPAEASLQPASEGEP